MSEIIMGRILSGNRNMLKSDSVTNAFLAVRTLASDDRTYAAKHVMATWRTRRELQRFVRSGGNLR